MTEHYQIVVVGSGPAGMSAAGRAAALGLSHVLLEKSGQLSNTIYKYQKGKKVFASPDVLPLRSDYGFAMGIREDILDSWIKTTQGLKVNVRYGAEVTQIRKDGERFTLAAAGKTVTADAVILAIGMQGNLVRLDVPGAADNPRIQYQLDDPDEYEQETVVVIGAGDSAIENAIGLARQNRVVIINRKGEFARLKQGNLDLLTVLLDKRDIECIYNAGSQRVDQGGADGKPMTLVLKTPEGEAKVACDRIIARLGAQAPRKFLEACGIKLPSAEPTALPELSPTYESNVKGLYVLGALAGCPLIKQAMNQGYEAVEYIRGNTTLDPADEGVLRERYGGVLAGYGKRIDDMVGAIKKSVPLLEPLTKPQIREVLLESKLHTPNEGDIVFRRDESTNTFYTILAGEVGIEVDPADPRALVRLGAGEFFGEMGLISGRKRSATVVATKSSIVLEISRREMIKLISSSPPVKRTLDRVAMERQIRTFLAPNISRDDLAEVLRTAELRTFKASDVLFKEGDPGDGVYLVRSGSCTVSCRIGGRDIVINYVPAGEYIGETALVRAAKRSATVRAAIETETVWIDAAGFRHLLGRTPELRQQIEMRIRDQIATTERMTQRPEAGSLIEFVVQEGGSEAVDMLLIDESLCIRCDNCEKACAETHNGISRLDREAGPTFATLHVPTSCRHCEHPHCMADCPPNVIHKQKDGEVFIDEKNCIGCGNCERNCPYGVIRMAYEAPEKPGLWSWLLWGLGSGPGEDTSPGAKKEKKGDARAIKCDMCTGIEGGPACVRSCPTGAAIRVRPEEFFELIRNTSAN